MPGRGIACSCPIAETTPARGGGLAKPFMTLVFRNKLPAHCRILLFCCAASSRPSVFCADHWIQLIASRRRISSFAGGRTCTVGVSTAGGCCRVATRLRSRIDRHARSPHAKLQVSNPPSPLAVVCFWHRAPRRHGGQAPAISSQAGFPHNSDSPLFALLPPRNWHINRVTLHLHGVVSPRPRQDVALHIRAGTRPRAEVVSCRT